MAFLSVDDCSLRGEHDARELQRRFAARIPNFQQFFLSMIRRRLGRSRICSVRSSALGFHVRRVERRDDLLHIMIVERGSLIIRCEKAGTEVVTWPDEAVLLRGGARCLLVAVPAQIAAGQADDDGIWVAGSADVRLAGVRPEEFRMVVATIRRDALRLLQLQDSDVADGGVLLASSLIRPVAEYMHVVLGESKPPSASVRAVLDRVFEGLVSALVLDGLSRKGTGGSRFKR